MFKEPVEVLPNVNYTACATLKVGPVLHPRACLFPVPAGCGCPSVGGSQGLGHPDLTMTSPPPGPGFALWHQRSTQGDP